MACRFVCLAVGLAVAVDGWSAWHGVGRLRVQRCGVGVLRARKEEASVGTSQSAEQKAVVDAVVESAFASVDEEEEVELGGGSSSTPLPTAEEEEIDQKLLKALGLGAEASRAAEAGVYASTTLRTVSAAVLKAKVALESAAVWFEGEAEKNSAILEAVVEYVKRRVAYDTTRLLEAAEDVMSKNVSVGDAFALLSAGVDPTSLLQQRTLKKLAPTETRDAKLLSARDAKKDVSASRASPVKALKAASSVKDIYYEVRRESREQSPGDRAAARFPAIAPALAGVGKGCHLPSL